MSAERENELLEQVPTGLFIAGEWVDAEGGRTFDVHDPSTNAVIRSRTLIAASRSGGSAASIAAST